MLLLRPAPAAVEATPAPAAPRLPTPPATIDEVPAWLRQQGLHWIAAEWERMRYAVEASQSPAAELDSAEPDELSADSRS